MVTRDWQVFGNYINDGGKPGQVMLSDSNPFGLRDATTRTINASNNADRFSARFNTGFTFSINDGQGSYPNAGLFIRPSAANTAAVSNPAFVGINKKDPVAELDVAGNGTISGTLAIGLTAPSRGKVEIAGGGGAFAIGASYVYQNSGPGALPSGTYSGNSLYCTNYVSASAFIAFSDERIKHIAGRSDATRDLSTLCAIEVTDYTYIDTLVHGAGKQKKIIAQQVEKVFPQAVNRSTDTVPDIFKKAEIKNGWVKLATNLQKGERVRLIGEKKEGIHEVFEVASDGFRTDFAAEAAEVFVYGREVRDFRTVDYEAISMLNVSATQELARKVEAKDAEVAKLRAENAALAKKLTALEARDEAREARLARIEAAGKDRPARAVPASFEPNASVK